MILLCAPTLGADYDLTPCDTLAVYYQTKLGFTFPDAVLVNGNYRDLSVDQPETVGFGYATGACWMAIC